MADGVTLKVNKANIQAKSLEGVGLTPKNNDKDLFKKDDHTELMQALHDLPDSFREVLKQTMDATGQTFLKEFFNQKSNDTPEEPKEHFQKPTDKENDVKKLAAKYGTPALFLGSKIDDIIKILIKPVKEIATSKNNPISAAGVIVLGSNVENSKKYIKDFQELTNFISKQKVPDIGAFQETQKKLDALSESMKKSTETKVDTKSSEKFTKSMGSITANFGQVVKQVMTLNALTSLINFKKETSKLKEMDKYLKKLSSMGDNLGNFAMNLAKASTDIYASMKIIIKASLFSKIANVAIKSVNTFISQGIKSLLDSVEELDTGQVKTISESFEDIRNLSMSLLKTSIIFSVIAPFALVGWLGIKVSKIFVSALSEFVEYLNKNFDNKKIQESMKAIGSIVILVALTSLSMFIASKVVDVAMTAVLGAAALALFAVGMAYVLKIMGNLVQDVAKGMLAAVMVTAFALLAFVALKALSSLTPKMIGHAMLALLGFIGIMAACALLGVAAMYVMIPLALGVAAASLATVFALFAFLSLKVFGMIQLDMITHAFQVMIGDGKNIGLVAFFASFIPLSLIGPIALLALSTAMPASIMMAIFAVATKIAIDKLSTIEGKAITQSAKNVALMALPLSATALVAPAALAAMASLPSIIAAMTMMVLAVLPFKLMTILLGDEPFYSEKNPLLEKTGILGFINTMTIALGFLGLAAMVAPLAMVGASLISTILILLLPSILIFSKVAKYFNKKAEINLVDSVYGNNISKPLTSKYGLIPFIGGSVLAANLLWGGTISFLMGSISALLMSLFFSNLKKSLDAMDQLVDSSKKDIDIESVTKYLNLIELVAKKAGSPGLLKSVGEAVKSWVSEKLGTSTADLINKMTESITPMKNLSDQLEGIHLDNISLFLEALNKIQSIKSSPNNKAIKNAISGVKELTDSIDSIDSEKFNANISSIMPGIEKLQNIPEGSGLSKKAKEIKSAITTIFSAKTGKDADAMIDKIDRLTVSLERLSKVDSSSIAKTLGTSDGVYFKEKSSSTLGAETSNIKATSSTINVDNSSIENILSRILDAINDLKKTKSWTDEAL